MDPKLAEIYGTNQTTDADIEKLAAAELATQLAGDEQIADTEGMTEEDLEAIAQEVLAPETETQVEEPQEQTEQEKTSAEKQAQEKVAEADYLGRTMAHAYVQELNKIAAAQEKTAGWGDAPQKMLGAATKSTRAKAAVGKVIGKAGEIAKNHGKAIAGTAAATGTAGVLAGRASKGKDKKSAAEGEQQQLSAVDTLVLARANEILEASGIDPKSLSKVEEPVEQEKTSADETTDPRREALATAVEQRAWELLGQYGVTPAEEK
jgi:hypothetical protein